MALFSAGRKDEYTALIFDIGSASVGAAIVDVKSEEKPDVLYSTRAPLSFQEDLNFDYFMRSMLGVLLQVSLKLQGEGLTVSGRRVDRIACFFSSPWFISQTRILKTKRQSPFIVSRRFIERSIQKAKEDISSSKLVQQAENLEGGGVLIEHHIIQTILNGYPLSDPYGKEAHDVTVALFMSLLSQNVADKVEEVFEKVFRTDSITFNSFTFSSFLTVRDMFFDTDNFLLMDISGEVSDISIVHNDILYETASFPLGKNSIIRELSKEKRILPEEAHSSLKLSAEGLLKEEEREKVISTLEKKWLDAVKGALASLGDDLPLPQQIYITADKDIAPWFEKTLAKGDFSDVAYAAHPFVPTFLSSKNFSHISFQKSASLDPFIAIEALFLNRGM